MTNTIKMVFAMIIFFATTSVAQDPVTKEKWSEGMRTLLPVLLCEESSFFRECFDVTAEKCEEVALSTTRVCLENIKEELPSIFESQAVGEKWRREVGVCAGTAYELALIKNKLDKPKCYDPSVWR